MGWLSSALGGIGGFLIGGPVGGLVGAGLGYASDKASSQAQDNYNQQMSFAQSQAQFQQDYARNVMQWRVEDAKKAGVHPMAALGISNPSYSPVSSPSAPAPTDYNAMFDTATTFGQNLNRASFQAKTQQQQLDAIGLANKNMELQNKGLEQENYWRGLQIGQLESNLRNGGISAAPAPDLNQAPGTIPGQSDSWNPPKDPQGQYMDKPIVRDGWLIDEKGRKMGIIPSDDLAQRFEDKLILEWVPFAGSMVRGFRGKFLGQKVNGHWWHGEDKGFLTYPPENVPKGKGGFFENARDAMRFYRDYESDD